jgi:hypothetical protein
MSKKKTVTTVETFRWDDTKGRWVEDAKTRTTVEADESPAYWQQPYKPGIPYYGDLTKFYCGPSEVRTYNPGV